MALDVCIIFLLVVISLNIMVTVRILWSAFYQWHNKYADCMGGLKICW